MSGATLPGLLTRSAAAKTIRVVAPSRKRAAIADPEAREFLRDADPVLARLIDARPGLPSARLAGRAPSARRFRHARLPGRRPTAVRRFDPGDRLASRERFGGHLPSPAELLAADPQVLRDSGFSARKGQTLRALAERFVDGRLSDEALRACPTTRSRRP